MASIFTKIIQGDIPSYRIAENEDFFAFLDINPNAPGHTLVVPKQEVDKILDLDESTYSGLMAFARKLGLAIEKAVECERVGLFVIGLEVPHVHVHLIPLRTMADATFANKVSLMQEDFEEIAAKIRAKLQ